MCDFVNSGTLVQGAFMDSRTSIGLIIATGSNACYLERADRIEKWEGERHGEREVRIYLTLYSIFISVNITCLLIT